MSDWLPDDAGVAFRHGCLKPLAMGALVASLPLGLMGLAREVLCPAFKFSAYFSDALVPILCFGALSAAATNLYLERKISAEEHPERLSRRDLASVTVEYSFIGMASLVVGLTSSIVLVRTGCS